MSEVVHGSATVLVGTETVFDPNNGLELRQVYKGAQASIDALVQAYYLAGWKVTKSLENGVHQCAVTIPNYDGTNPETPIDKWQVNFDFFQTPIWDHPGIMYGIQLYADTYYSGDYDACLCDLRCTIENGLKGKHYSNGEWVEYGCSPVPPGSTTFEAGSFGYKLYSLLMRGTESFEVERPVLSRVRTYSAAYLTRFQMPVWPTIYTTSQLISAYAIPAVTQTQMPSDPAFVPTDCTWGWKERRHNLEIDYQGKVTETLDWVFAAWSNLLYLAQT